MAELTINEAAAALHLAPDTIRRRILRGELQARQDVRGRYLVEVDVEPPAPVSEDSALLASELEAAKALLEEVRHSRDGLEEALAAARQGEAELRRLLSQAMRALPAGPETPEEQPPTPTAPKRRWRWPWGR